MIDPVVPAPGWFDVRLRVRYSETDAQRVAWHGNFFSYFEVGRTEMMRAAGVSYADMERDGFRLVVAEASATYLSPARYDEEIRISTRVADLGPARVVFEYGIHGGDGREVARGATTLACTDASGRIVRLPARVAGRLAEAARGARPDNEERIHP